MLIVVAVNHLLDVVVGVVIVAVADVPPAAAGGDGAGDWRNGASLSPIIVANGATLETTPLSVPLAPSLPKDGLGESGDGSTGSAPGDSPPDAPSSCPSALTAPEGRCEIVAGTLKWYPLGKVRPGVWGMHRGEFLCLSDGQCGVHVGNTAGRGWSEAPVVPGGPCLRAIARNWLSSSLLRRENPGRCSCRSPPCRRCLFVDFPPVEVDTVAVVASADAGNSCLSHPAMDAQLPKLGLLRRTPEWG